MAYLTIKEYAELKSITTQTVYKKIRAGKLETIAKTVDGTEKKYILVDAPTAEPTPEQAAGGAQSAEKNILEQAIQALTAQLAEKDKQIEKLTALLDHAQQLQGHAQMMLEAPKADPPEQAAPDPAEEKPKKYNFWKWLASI